MKSLQSFTAHHCSGVPGGMKQCWVSAHLLQFCLLWNLSLIDILFRNGDGSRGWQHQVSLTNGAVGSSAQERHTVQGFSSGYRTWRCPLSCLELQINSKEHWSVDGEVPPWEVGALLNGPAREKVGEHNACPCTIPAQGGTRNILGSCHQDTSPGMSWSFPKSSPGLCCCGACTDCGLSSSPASCAGLGVCSSWISGPPSQAPAEKEFNNLSSGRVC